jgi:hypothetical protein
LPFARQISLDKVPSKLEKNKILPMLCVS